MSNVLSQGVYAPLPQCLSDSESDKETSLPNNWKKSNGKKNGTLNAFLVPNPIINFPKSKSGFRSMSTARKCWFIISILVCFLTIFTFLWVLPCSGTCPVNISNWKIEQENMEFAGRINIVQGAFELNKNIVMLFKRNLNNGNSHNGVISLLGSVGAVAWLIPQTPEPKILDCYSIDVNLDGVKDCLLLGELGLECIDPISGEVYWHVHSHFAEEDKLVLSLDFPQILPDLNSDSVNELITVTNQNSLRNKVIIASGSTGIVLTEFVITTCEEISQITILDNMFIYYCHKSKAKYSSYYKITVDDLWHKVRESNYGNGNSNNGDGAVSIVPTKIQYEPKQISDYLLNNRRLTINNVGICPNCRVNIHLLQDKTLEQLWSTTYANTYAMIPTYFSFKVTKKNALSLRGHLNGFILKLWQYNDFKPVYKYASSTNRSVQVNNIFERVVVITFNDTNVHLINASFVNITQLCFPAEFGQVCQPDIKNQNESILIGDLDKDETQELISYTSTFECIDDDVDNCHLVSSMKVIRLEAELPKLYEAAK